MTEQVLEVKGLVKRYDGITAVDDLSFEVNRGEIFGLLGPNGAGKTTSIRIIMDIFYADEGEVRVLGDLPGRARARVGYLPEERGLYRDIEVLDVLIYLAELKGIMREEARKRALAWLERVELGGWARNKVKDLSRGMQQKVQFVVSLVHDPQLLILDEPFQGLDPVNVALIKSLIRELAQEGKTILLSSHQMNVVEAVCDRIVLINHGRAVLYGPLAEIKRAYAPHSVTLRTPDALDGLPGVSQFERGEEGFRLTLEDDVTPQALLTELVARSVYVEAFEEASASLEDVFIAVVKEAGDA